MKNMVALRSAFIAFFAACVCVGCFIKIPIGIVPIVLQNVLCVLTGILLGGVWGGAPTALFLLAGLVGLPVYAGGTSGIAVWLGPTGGFYPGYLLGAVVAGFVAGIPSVSEKRLGVRTVARVSAAMLSGMLLLYIPGVIRFSYWALGAGNVPVEKSLFAYTLGACVIPYIPGDILKMAVAVPVALKIRPVLAQYFYSGRSSSAGSGKKMS